MVGGVRGRLAAGVMVVSLIAAGGAGIAGAQTDPQPNAPETQDPVEEFFVFQARNGSLVEKGDALELTLNGVDDKAVVFTDRPNRFTGSIKVKKFLGDWDDEGLDQDPPNAALTVNDGKGAGGVIALELTKPSRSGKTVTFTAHRLESFDGKPEVADALAEQVGSSDQTVPENFGSSSLFIDPVNDIMQYCFGLVVNNTGSTIVGKGTNLPIPTSSPITIVPNNTQQTVSSMGPGGCFISYGFSTGARGWHIDMAAVTSKDNVSSCSGNCVRTVTHDTSTYRVTFEFR